MGSLPNHGTPARYQRGCRCQPCTRATVRMGTIRRLEALQGNPRKVPPGPVVAHLADLREEGMSWGQIAHAAGTANSTPREIALGMFNTILRSTAERLLAVQPGKRPAVGYISAIGAQRRLQALYALAHAHKDLVTRTRVSSATIEDILCGKYETVSVPVDTAIRSVYSELSMTVGNSPRTRLRARREGWAPPLAWDDIDAPEAEPDLGEDVPRPVAVAEDVEFLGRFGVDRELIAERVGLASWNSVEQAVLRARKVTA